jgi:hypothetical protein
LATPPPAIRSLDADMHALVTQAAVSQFVPSQLELQTLGLHLLGTLVLGHVLGWHYVRHAQVLGNKQKLARVFVWISVTTLLIISVVKVSLALSLGLVGALSIIRFRTPVKEPEELAYLFLAIAIGVGFGADRPWETVLVFVTVLLVVAVRSAFRGGGQRLRTVVQIELPGDGDVGVMPALLEAVSSGGTRVDLRRVDSHQGTLHASFLVDLDSMQRLQDLLARMRSSWPQASISVVERDGLE